MLIRQEVKQDYKRVENVVKESFLNEELTDHTEHKLVDKLRNSEDLIPELSLVAEVDNNIVGHILLTKAKIVNDDLEEETLALAPLAVLPEYQSKGVGKALMNAAIIKARELGYISIVVLGHDKYYPKFGFEKASKYGVKCPFEVPDEVYMILMLDKDKVEAINGVVRYSEAFN